MVEKIDKNNKNVGLGSQLIPPPFKQVRLSNIELLRCVSMFMVLMMHTSFITFGFPSEHEVKNAPMEWCFHSLQYSIAIVAVNIFVMISGWFSIKPSVVGLSKFLFQVIFLKLLSYSLFVALGIITLSKDSLSELLMLAPFTGWFIKTYLLLFILTPVLNSFVEHTNRITFRKVLIFYFLFVFTFGWIKDITGYIMRGYSITMFVGLYLLARYIKIYEPTWSQFSKKKDFGLYLLMTVFSFGGMFLTCLFAIPKNNMLVGAFTSYSSPFVVIGAMYVLLLFSKINIGRQVMLNNIAKSCFAVYLLHFMWGNLPKIVLDLYARYSASEFYVILYAFLVLLFFVCITVDQIRIFVWDKFILKFISKVNAI